MATSKKGLQLQMIDDALALGVKHAALNLNFGRMLQLNQRQGSIPFTNASRIYYFDGAYVEAMDRQIRPLSDAGVQITLILLNYAGQDEALNKILLHPGYDPKCPNHLSAFNTTTPEAAGYCAATAGFLAQRYSSHDSPRGRVVNYVIGNEVNSHWHWCNMGRVTMEQFADDYLRTVRLVHSAIREYSPIARVYVSLEHHWNIRYAGGDAAQTFAGRPFLDYFARRAREGGDFDWHVAFHPYPENLFEPRTWNDKTAAMSPDTPRITFKNIELLPKYLRRDELLFHGKPRRIILSEQGFHSAPSENGELAQAAAYCYAYRKVASLEGIDAFILHRHVDHANEGGLNLGLWARKQNTISDPARRKPIYEVFRAADTTEWENAFRFALPIIGITNWSALSNH